VAITPFPISAQIIWGQCFRGHEHRVSSRQTYTQFSHMLVQEPLALLVHHHANDNSESKSGPEKVGNDENFVFVH
jgi:hypothetical protein